MKTILNILLLAVLTTGVFNGADAQRRGGDGGSSRGQSGGSSQRGGEGGYSRGNVSARPDRGNSGGSRYNSNPGNIQRSERQVVTRQSTVRTMQPRNEVLRSNDSRVGVDRLNRGPVDRIGSNRGNYRYGGGNNYAYNNRYNGYYRTGYHGYNGYNGYARGFGFAYGPRYSIIPRGRISLYFGGNPYYFYNGFYYGYYGGFYEPIFPPIGLRIGFLPYGYSSLYIGGFPYYYYNGTYYRHYDDENYEVVDPPMGATVSSLPKGAKAVTLNGEKMYELNGTYYKEDSNSKGEVIYTVVGKNGEINNSDNSINNNNAPGNNDLATPPPAAPPANLQIGDTVNQLPEGSKVVTINGEKMYVAPDDTYLKEESNNGIVQYKVVGTGNNQ